MSKYITDTTSQAAKEMFLLVQAYEDAQKNLAEVIKEADQKLYKCDNTGFNTPESIAEFKKKRANSHSTNYYISSAKNKVSEASKALDELLTDFMVNKLDSEPNEFIRCGDHSNGVVIVRRNKQYHIMHSSGSSATKQQLADYLRKHSL